uniref:Uncharacterized protein n=1 Tax=Oryza sativa subsp. japonica TaxID=39947 RepID=Q33BJ5_ORYSJ|nr:hypothetical protein LOC_Os10g01330 [Oryza sativa Japonica Group]
MSPFPFARRGRPNATPPSIKIFPSPTTSGGDIPKKGRKFSAVIGHRRKAPTPLPFRRAVRAKAAQDGSGGTSSASPAVASTDVVVVPGSREATPSGPASDPVAGRGSPAAVLSWEELQVEMGRLLEAGARVIGREIAEARVAAVSANKRADRLAHDLAEAREDLKKMRELLAGKCGIKSTIPANPDEFSLTSSLAELAAAMEEIPSKHAARIGEEMSNRIYIGACHILACVRLAHPELDLREILDQGEASDARKDVMEEVGDLGKSVLPLFEEDVDVEDVQQRGQPESPAIIPALAFEPHTSPDDVDQILPARTGMATNSLDLESELASQDRRIQYWKTKCEVAELERTMLEVKKEQAVETL